MNARDRNRQQYPATAAMVDEVRRVFPEARLVAAIEAGREVGKVTDELRALAREEGIA